MRVTLRRFDNRDLGAVVALSLRAWEPVFASIRATIGAELDDAMHGDWRKYQAAAVERVCMAPEFDIQVAEVDGAVAGFVAVRLLDDEPIGAIAMLAVDPDCQGRGIGRTLTDAGLAAIKAMGVPVAMVETGGDPGHAPARKVYEAAGFQMWPVAKYFLKF